VLIVALILLLILTLIGVTAARMQTSEEGMARNEDNHQLALQAAEAALRDGESIIPLHTQADFLSDTNGLWDLPQELQAATPQSIADTINWSAPGANSMQYSGASLSNAPASPQPAQIIIESLPPVAGPGSPLTSSGYGLNAQWQVYRVTAHAEGGDGTSSVTLQSVVSSVPPQ
jgi:type IV pilus assembly protein PilX